MRFSNDNGALVFYHQGEMTRIEAWGKDSFRVRSTMLGKFTGNIWALTEKVPSVQTRITLEQEDHWVGDGTIDKKEIATIVNGRLKAVVNFAGILSFYRDEKLILREYYRSYDGTLSRESRCLKIVGRQWKGVIGGTDYSLNVKFESNEGEKIFAYDGRYGEDGELLNIRYSHIYAGETAGVVGFATNYYNL